MFPVFHFLQKLVICFNFKIGVLNTVVLLLDFVWNIEKLYPYMCQYEDISVTFVLFQDNNFEFVNQ